MKNTLESYLVSFNKQKVLSRRQKYQKQHNYHGKLKINIWNKILYQTTKFSKTSSDLLESLKVQVYSTLHMSFVWLRWSRGTLLTCGILRANLQNDSQSHLFQIIKQGQGRIDVMWFRHRSPSSSHAVFPCRCYTVPVKMPPEMGSRHHLKLLISLMEYFN